MRVCGIEGGGWWYTIDRVFVVEIENIERILSSPVLKGRLRNKVACLIFFMICNSSKKEILNVFI
jgi:hypothetical protein